MLSYNCLLINLLIRSHITGIELVNLSSESESLKSGSEKYDETIIDSINGDPSVKKALYYDTKTQLFANNKNISVYIT